MPNMHSSINNVEAELTRSNIALLAKQKSKKMRLLKVMNMKVINI